jgi:hypothetical protein
VSGVVTAGVACHDLKGLGEHVNYLALTLVSPLGPDYDRSSASARLTSVQRKLQVDLFRGC